VQQARKIRHPRLEPLYRDPPAVLLGGEVDFARYHVREHRIICSRLFCEGRLLCAKRRMPSRPRDVSHGADFAGAVVCLWEHRMAKAGLRLKPTAGYMVADDSGTDATLPRSATFTRVWAMHMASVR
jgi:hypothetical protein